MRKERKKERKKKKKKATHTHTVVVELKTFAVQSKVVMASECGAFDDFLQPNSAK